MSQTIYSATRASLLLLVVLSALVAPNFSKIILDYRIPLTAKVADLTVKTTALGKLTKDTIQGTNSLAEAYEFLKPATGKFQQMVLKINDKSIFQDQKGFRRNDIVPVYDPVSIEKDIKTYHHSFIVKKDGKLDLRHGYLLASVEFAKADGTHIYDIHLGTPFKSDNTAGTKSPDADFFRVRDINFKTLFDVKMIPDTIFNFAIEVDWKQNKLSVYHSTGNDKLKQVVKPTAFVATNEKAKNAAGTGEWHIQMIKEPLPNKADPEKERSDVPHKGIQESNIDESIIHFRNFIEDKTTTDPDGPDAIATGGTAAIDAARQKTRKP